MKMKKQNYKFKTFLIISFLSTLFSLTSCLDDYPIKPEYTKKRVVVLAKRIDIEEGTTRYNIAFTDGTDASFTFGVYSNYEIKDTMFLIKDKNDFYPKWVVVDKSLFDRIKTKKQVKK
jgi:hypothetical protein